ncbi:MAG: hypothetical protein INR71_15590 [Terriglobus roseus]|nr:hypothetical protein [Terriglobus roseus]
MQAHSPARCSVVLRHRKTDPREPVAPSLAPPAHAREAEQSQFPPPGEVGKEAQPD